VNMGFQAPACRTVTAVLFGFIIITLLFQSRSKIPFRICHDRDREEVSTSQKRTFTRVPTFEDMSHENDAAWAATVMPEKLGFIYVKYNETFSIERGISMFHAMHCLSLLREMLQMKLPGESSQSHQHGSKAGHESANHLREQHMPHCLSYVAQVSQWLVTKIDA
jgi:Mycotoxin biosynthesis protein UstYa